MLRWVLASWLAAACALRSSVHSRHPVTRLIARAPPKLCAKSDGGLGDVVDEAAAALGPPVDSSEKLELGNRFNSRGSRHAVALWRVGWASWWGQLVLSVVAAVVVAFASVVSAPRGPAAAAPSLLANGVAFSGLGAASAFVSLVWTWRYTRLAKLASKNVPGTLERTRGALRFGATINLVGMALSLVSAQQVVGTLIAKSLVSPGAINALVGGAAYAGAAAPLSPVVALDIFVVQANTNTLCSHLIGLASSLGLLSRSDKWE